MTAQRIRLSAGLLATFFCVALCWTGCDSPRQPGQAEAVGPWPQWRGVGGSGVSTEIGLPVHWSKETGYRWSAKLPGSGASSPIVSNETVYLTAVLGIRGASQVPIRLVVVAVDLTTGELDWTTQVVERQKEKRHWLNSPASPTPATDGEKIFAYFGSHLVALSVSGTLLWTEEVDPEYLERSHWGAGSSLILTDDSVVVFQDREELTDEVGWLAAFSKAEGKRLWRTEWSESCCAYTTPQVVDSAGGRQLFVVHARGIAGYDIATGEQLWHKDQDMNQPVASAVVEGDLACVASGAHGVREMVCWRFGEAGNEVTPLWRTKRGVPATASPVLHEGFLYVVTEKGVVSCYEAKTGNRMWQQRLPAGNYHASLVLGDGKLYALNRKGTVSVIEAGPKYRFLAANELAEGGVIASPAIAAGCLLVRSHSHLFCIEGTGSGPDSALPEAGG